MIMNSSAKRFFQAFAIQYHKKFNFSLNRYMLGVTSSHMMRYPESRGRLFADRSVKNRKWLLSKTVPSSYSNLPRKIVILECQFTMLGIEYINKPSSLR